MQKTISFLIDVETKKTLKEMAKEDDGRSLTAFIRIKLIKMAKEWKDNK